MFLKPTMVLINISLPMLSVPNIWEIFGAANLSKSPFPRLNLSEIKEIINTVIIINKLIIP